MPQKKGKQYVGSILPELRENIRSVLEEDTDQKIAEVDAAVKQKQAELLDAGRDQEKIDEIGDAIMQLRDERQQILTQAAMRKDVKDRIEDLASFLDEQTQAVTEYSDVLVRRLIERITVYDEMLVVEFKSGLEIEVDAQEQHADHKNMINTVKHVHSRALTREIFYLADIRKYCIYQPFGL